MAENKITLKIVTPTRELYNSPVDMVIMRTKSGDVGILHGHQPMVTVLDYGILRIQNDGDEELKATVFGGFAEIDSETITILSDAAEWPDEIDVHRAQAAKERAEKRLREQNTDTDLMRVQLSLRRALIRLDVTNKK